MYWSVFFLPVSSRKQKFLERNGFFVTLTGEFLMPTLSCRSRRSSLSRMLNGAASTMVLACLVSPSAFAQTVIPDGDNTTRTSAADDEIFVVNAGSTSEVNGAPVVIFDNNDVVLNNAGTLRTLGVTNTVQVNAATIGGVVNNALAGILEADSRVIDIQGDGFTLNNEGIIRGTGDQRNGTVYVNRTGNDFELNNIGPASVIDAGVGNNGAGISIEVGGGGAPITGLITNEGLIQGRGQVAAPANTAGDGIRFFGPGLAPTYNFAGDIVNSGTIASESAVGPVAGIRFSDIIQFTGTLTNEATGVISGVNNGLYFGDAVHTGGTVNNLAGGVISSGSRALNIDGTGLVVNNAGSVLGTGNQRNGTVYADSTAQGFTLNNLAGGLIDAGAGLEGAGFSVELSSAGNDFTIDNAGTIQGRGNAGAGLATAGDGLRFERTRVGGVLDGTTSGLFTGDIVNSGTIDSEAANGTAAGIRFVNGASFNGTIDNSGTISGVQNGLYFGNATPAGGGDFTGAVVNNLAGGVISSGSRALNIDGTGLVVNNAGSILGTGDQRNGTVYSDATAEGFVLNNLAGGVIDAGAGNNGSGVSLQSGNVDGETVSFTVNNAGAIRGRGTDLVPAGIRVFNGAANVTVDGDITNSGDISSETGAAILIENVNFTGSIINSGTLTGAVAFDASTALGGVDFTQTGGALNGDFIGSSFADSLTVTGDDINGSILGGVTTTIAAGGSAAILGQQTLEGDLIANGDLNFVLGADSLTVVGNTTFGANSNVNIVTPDDITLLPLGSPISVIAESGSFTDNGVSVNVLDDDFLVDFSTQIGSVSVVANAADLSGVSTDANISLFAGAASTAFSNNTLDVTVANALNDVADAAEFEVAASSLLPSLNEGVTREIFETQSAANSLLDRRLQGENVGAWGQIHYRTADRDAASVSVEGYEADAFSIAIGADKRLTDTLTAGVAFNYADIDIDETGAIGEEIDIKSYQVSGYAGLNDGAFFANGQVGYSFNDVETVRGSVVGPVSGAFDVNGFNAQGTVGYALSGGQVTLTPQASIHYANLSQDSFSETGGLNLSVDAEDVSFLDLKAGFEVSTSIDNAGWSLRPVARAAYVYDAIGDARVLNASFAGGASPLVLTSGDPAQSRVEYGAGLEASSDNGWTFSLEYDGETASDYQSHGGFVRARFNF